MFKQLFILFLVFLPFLSYSSESIPQNSDVRRYQIITTKYGNFLFDTATGTVWKGDHELGYGVKWILQMPGPQE